MEVNNTNDIEGDIPALTHKKKAPKYKHRKTSPCPFNEGVHCNEKKCESCGFNPKVKRSVR